MVSWAFPAMKMFANELILAAGLRAGGYRHLLQLNLLHVGNPIVVLNQPESRSGDPQRLRQHGQG